MSRSSGCPGSLKARPGVVFHMISADFTKLFHAFVRPLFELRALKASALASLCGNHLNDYGVSDHLLSQTAITCFVKE